MNWILSQKDDGYEFVNEGPNLACGVTERIGDFQEVDEDGCKKKCDADENCTYLWHRSANQRCILCIQDTVAPGKQQAKLFKKKGDWNSINMNSIVSIYLKRDIHRYLHIFSSAVVIRSQLTAF